MIGRNSPCICGSGRKIKQCGCALSQDGASLKRTLKFYEQNDVHIKSSEQIHGIRQACHLAAKILDEVALSTTEGTTTEALDMMMRELCKDYRARPAPLGYGFPPYPAALCTSINEVICHGIPSKRALMSGDCINLDVSVEFNGYYGDCSKMVAVGECLPENIDVMRASYDSMMAAIEVLKPGVPLNMIGEMITRLAHERGCSVVEDFGGHGLGVNFHEGPHIFHNRNDIDIPIPAGLIFTIEPMINAGTHHYVTGSDGWTISTRDGKLSAQWEHALLITPEGYEILTPWTVPDFIHANN